MLAERLHLSGILTVVVFAMVTSRRASVRARLSDYLGGEDAAATRDALRTASEWFDAVFVVRPSHNPIGVLDLRGAYDERSDRWQPLGELVDRGYEDAYRQFIEPVVGASGESLDSIGARS